MEDGALIKLLHSDKNKGMEQVLKKYTGFVFAIVKSRLEYFDRIIWSGDTALAHEPSDVETLTDWNGIKITRELYDRLQTASNDDLFAVTAKLNTDIPDNFEEFVYNGKKCREYLDEYNRTYPIFRVLYRLEYCAAGNSDAFESWVKDSITEEQGEEFLSKYRRISLARKRAL